MIRMVVFDMAGTTVDENNLVYKTLRKAINDDGFDLPLEKVLAAGAGKEKLQAIKSILTLEGINESAHADRIYAKFIVSLKKAYNAAVVLAQPNALEVFQALQARNIFVVLNTGYNRDTALSLTEKLNWKKGVQYDDLITADDVQQNRPQPDMILLAMQRFGIAAGAEVMKVGDSAIDIEEGKNAGCGLSIGITTGAHTREQLRAAHPDHIIDNLLEILPLIGE